MLYQNNAKQHSSSFDMPMDDAEEQRRKVAERIQKLRNLSFNINNASDPNNEFDAVPAYVRSKLRFIWQYYGLCRKLL